MKDEIIIYQNNDLATVRKFRIVQKENRQINFSL